MDPQGSPRAPRINVFREAEYRADPAKVIAHAEATGIAYVVRADGTTRFLIAIPPAEPPDLDTAPGSPRATATRRVDGCAC